MPASFVNYQIKSDDQSVVTAAADELCQGRAYISPPNSGWVTLYDENSELQDAYEIGRLGSELSARLNTVVFAFLTSESTLFVYYVFENGDLMDEYHSVLPPTSSESGSHARHRFAGQPEVLLKYCLPGVTKKDLELTLLRNDSLVEGGFGSGVNAEERLHPLAAALQMDDLRILLGFADFDRQKAGISQSDLYKKVDARRRRRGPSKVPPKLPPR